MRETIKFSIQQTYFGLSLSQISDYESIKKKVEEYKQKKESSLNEDDAYIAELNARCLSVRLNQAVVAPVVSLAMTLEAFSYDYSVLFLGEKFVKEYLEKANPVSRMAITAKIKTGKQIPKDLLRKLKRLYSVRNRIVHFKTKTFSDADQALRHAARFSEDLAAMIYSGRDALRELMRWLDEAHDHKYQFIWSLEPAECHA